MKKYLFVLGLFSCIGACSQPQNSISAMTIPVTEIAEKTGNVQQLSERFDRLQRGYRDVIRITQFGDSHSAADFFTGKLRTVLQQRYGDAGIGWVSPIFVHWQLLDSRRDDYEGNYPMGGYVARSESDMGFIRLKHRNNDEGKWSLKLLIKDNYTNDWQVASYTTTLPAEIGSKREGMEVGGVWLTRVPATGVIVETVAANGAKNTLWDKWGAGWLQRDLAT